MKFDELLIAYGQSIRIQDLDVGEGGGLFEFDDCAIAVRHDSVRERVVFVAEIGPFNDARHEEVSAKLLGLNLATMLSGGLSLGADEETGNYCCSLSLPLESLDVAGFERVITEMITKVKASRELLEIEAQAAQAIAAREHEQAASSGDTFIRV